MLDLMLRVGCWTVIVLIAEVLIKDDMANVHRHLSDPPTLPGPGVVARVKTEMGAVDYDSEAIHLSD